jgi:NitT/TauT family transport system permease protein
MKTPTNAANPAEKVSGTFVSRAATKKATRVANAAKKVSGTFFLVLPPIIVLVALVFALEWYLKWAGVPKWLVPKPSQVFAAAKASRETLLHATGQTAIAAGIGFAASALVGILIAIFLSSSRLVRNAFYPYAIFFQTVPVVAIAPMLVIWFEAGLQSVAICAFIVSVFPVVANTLAGLLSTDPALRDLFRLYGAGPISRLIKLRLPWATPNIITGLRIAAGLSVIGAIVGEFVAAELSENAGLGILVATSARNARVDRVFAAIASASMLGLAMLFAVNLAGYLLLRRWHTET